MEQDNESGEKNKETLIYLDFNDKLPPELLEDKLFIQIVNLNDKNPLIQINDMIFKGSYTYSVGTNLFFKKSQNENPGEFPFQHKSTAKLQFYKAHTKVVNCKQMTVPPTTAASQEENRKIKYNFKWDYKELLDRLENGTLDVKDILSSQSTDVMMDNSYTSVTHEVQNNALNSDKTSELIKENMELPSEFDNTTKSFKDHTPELIMAYNKLQELAKIPVKHQTKAEKLECDPKYSSSYNYKVIESKVLTPPLFSYSKISSSEWYDVNRCVRLGLILPSPNYPRVLTTDEEKVVLQVENFENLSLPARYSVLMSHRKKLEECVNSNSLSENSQKDEFGNTPVETLEIYEKLILSLQKRIKEMSVI